MWDAAPGKQRLPNVCTSSLCECVRQGDENRGLCVCVYVLKLWVKVCMALFLTAPVMMKVARGLVMCHMLTKPDIFFITISHRVTVSPTTVTTVGVNLYASLTDICVGLQNSRRHLFDISEGLKLAHKHSLTLTHAPQ